LTEEEYIYRSILSNLYHYRRRKKNELGWSDEKFVMTDQTIKYIAQTMPKDEDELIKKIFHFKKPKKFQRDASEVLRLVKEGKINPKRHWGCYECEKPDITDPNLNGDYENYTFYSWMEHYGIKPYKTFSREAKELVAFKFVAFLNRIIDIAPKLSCNTCNNMLIPNWNYAKDEGAAYKVTVFQCNKRDCQEHQKGIYINHCINSFGKHSSIDGCKSLIDMRENKNKCDRGLYICNIEGCGGCCVDHKKEQIKGN